MSVLPMMENISRGPLAPGYFDIVNLTVNNRNRDNPVLRPASSFLFLSITIRL
jgi:hypothetical protein